MVLPESRAVYRPAFTFSDVPLTRATASIDAVVIPAHAGIQCGGQGIFPKVSGLSLCTPVSTGVTRGQLSITDRLRQPEQNFVFRRSRRRVAETDKAESIL